MMILNLIGYELWNAFSLIWSGGKRDQLAAFDEWSKMVFAKINDEKLMLAGNQKQFEVRFNESSTDVSKRIQDLFSASCQDGTIFPNNSQINLPVPMIREIVGKLQNIDFAEASTHPVDETNESFFRSVFRGELGQYYTMPQIARFTVAMLDINHEHFVLDPTSGSGGFLLEAIRQTWHSVDQQFNGINGVDKKENFAKKQIYGIEIHDILAQICKINLLLQHGDHTHIEGGRSCLDNTLLSEHTGRFHRVLGNPPFGDEVRERNTDRLGSNTLSNFKIAEELKSVQSEHVILESSIRFLQDGGRLGLVLPDGLLNNQSWSSNCPKVRAYISKMGFLEAVISLPDHAFRKSGAQNKTSIFFFRKFTSGEEKKFNTLLNNATQDLHAISETWEKMNHRTFFAEANYIGYTSNGTPAKENELYRVGTDGKLSSDQTDTILGEYRTFLKNPGKYKGRKSPDCMAKGFHEILNAHNSHRFDAKYFLFKREEQRGTPSGWDRLPIGEIMERRKGNKVDISSRPEVKVKVMSLSQNGEISEREAGKGQNPPEWRGKYLRNNRHTQWFEAHARDIVYSSIDLWKGCIAVVPADFNGALVTKEFPIYKVIDPRLDLEFLSYLFRTDY